MNDLSISRSPLDPNLRQSLIKYVYDIIGCMQYVHRQLGLLLPLHHTQSRHLQLCREQKQVHSWGLNHNEPCRLHFHRTSEQETVQSR